MPKSKGLTESALVAMLDRAIENNELSSDGEASAHRRMALKFLNGEVDFASQPGKSTFVSNDFSDTLHWTMPALLRTFLSSEYVGIYEPRREELVERVKGMGPDGQPMIERVDVSEDKAKQATDYVNYVLMTDCRGYSLLYAAFYEGLAFGNGLIKHWWDEAPVYETQDFSGLSEDALALLVSDPDVEIIEQSATLDEEAAAQMMAMAGGLPPEPPMIYSGRLKRKTDNGRLRVEALPHEDFFIGTDDTVIDEEKTLLCGHRYESTRSDLVKEGYPRDLVEDLPAKASPSADEDRVARGRTQEDRESDFWTELVEVRDCYIRVDYDGDGVSEWRRIVLGGDSGGRTVLFHDEWGDDLPFTDIVPNPVPHRYRGRSLFDDTRDIQRIKSQLGRQTLDNLYQTNNPQKVVRPNSVRNPDALLNQDLGQLVYADDPSAIRDLVVPFTAKESFGMMEYLDTVREARTGVSRAMIGLDADKLQNQSATAFQGAQSASYAKQETYARNIAENGMKRLFRCLLKLIVKHQDRARTIRLRGEWVKMDPRSWDAEMDVAINTGLGTGSRDRDMAVLGNVLGAQKEIIMQMGPLNDICDIRTYRDTLAKMVEISGLKNPERFFKEVTDDTLKKMQAQAAQASQKPDPRMMEAQAKLQLEGAKAKAETDRKMMEAQADIVLAQRKFEADMSFQNQKVAADFNAQRERHVLEMQALREKGALEIELKREEASERLRLRREEMMLEAQLTAEANAMRMAQSAPIADTNIQAP
jgi:hypothetical protein